MPTVGNVFECFAITFGSRLSRFSTSRKGLRTVGANSTITERYRGAELVLRLVQVFCWTAMLLYRHIPPMFETPTLLSDPRCAQKAVDGSRNIARTYRIQMTRDLFRHTIVNPRWGRFNLCGAGLTVSFANQEAVRRFIQRALAKRARAPRPIRVAYCIVPKLTHQTSTLVALSANEGC